MQVSVRAARLVCALLAQGKCHLWSCLLASACLLLKVTCNRTLAQFRAPCRCPQSGCALTPEAEDLVHKASCSQSVELQQRAYELQAIVASQQSLQQVGHALQGGGRGGTGGAGVALGWQGWQSPCSS